MFVNSMIQYRIRIHLLCPVSSKINTQKRSSKIKITQIFYIVYNTNYKILQKYNFRKVIDLVIHQ
jgi:predicted transcriptional regulator